MNHKRTGYLAVSANSKHQYEVNGVKYNVSSRFDIKLKREPITVKFKNYIKSDFAHLTDNINTDTLADEYICQTAGEKGEQNAV